MIHTSHDKKSESGTPASALSNIGKCMYAHKVRYYSTSHHDKDPALDLASRGIQQRGAHEGHTRRRTILGVTEYVVEMFVSSVTKSNVRNVPQS